MPIALFRAAGKGVTLMYASSLEAIFRRLSILVSRIFPDNQGLVLERVVFRKESPVRFRLVIMVHESSFPSGIIFGN